MPPPACPVQADPDLDHFFARSLQLQATLEPLYKFEDLYTLIGQGRVSELTRHPEAEKVYHDAFVPAVRQKYGSPSAFVLYRISLPPLEEPAAFTADSPPELWRAQLNSWPYGVPRDTEHWVVWTRLRLVDPDHKDAKASWQKIQQQGVTGMTGQVPPQLVEEGHLGVLSREPDSLGWQLRLFVLRYWPEDEYDTVFFVNPLAYQSIPDLAHMHVMARRRPISP